MSKAPPSRDERWIGAMMLSIVGCAVTLVAATMPEGGWAFGDTRVNIALPEAWRALVQPDAQPLVVPRWKPEDVSDLLAQYDSGWAAAVAVDTLAVVPETADVPPTAALDGGATMPLAVAETGASGAPGAFGDSVDTSALAAAASAAPPATRRVVRAIPDAGALPPALKMAVPEPARAAFARLFSGLDAHGDIQVLHYGDSQIEGDRISGVMRHAWQQRWGGSGPGLQAAVPLVQSFALKQKQFGPWERHTRYGRRDTTDRDERYGLMACYAAVADSTVDATCLELAPEPRNHRSFSQWSGVRMWHDTVATSCMVSLNGQVVDTLLPGMPAATLDLMPKRVDSLKRSTSRICFDGRPPRIFGLEPLGQGVQWHGVPMRGSSGTLFRKLDRPLLTAQLRQLDPDLVVLQFGGNMVPHCPDRDAAERYGGWFASQIRLFKRTLPQAAILVIGPSDMSEKAGLYWTSFPQLSDVRDVLRQTALAEGAAYWDLLEVMGGIGSMPAWVASEPPLAGPDHVHFTPLGAKRVGTLLDRSFMASYSEWQRNWAPPAPAVIRSLPAPPLPVSTVSHQPKVIHE